MKYMYFKNLCYTVSEIVISKPVVMAIIYFLSSF